ncbi:MAG: hypothetical protein IPK82_37790 [Polyangiaceae bacterium]|nr:hypothetical protein [Polyangiaceae bacterium]
MKRSTRLTPLSLTAAVGITLLTSQTALAQTSPTPSPQDIALAEKAFNEGIALAQAGNCKDAVVKLELSQKIDPASGTALNLGRCYETLGRTASAYGAYSQSAGLARVKVNDKIRAEAEAGMAAVAPKLSNLELKFAAGAAIPKDLTITVDGKAISSDALGTAFPVDPGVREIQVSAPGKKTHTAKVDVAAKPGNTTLQIPALEDAPPPPPPPGEGMSTTALATTLGLAGVGVVGLGVGIGFGVDSMGKNDASKKECQAPEFTKCTSAGVDLRNQAFSSATGSNVGFIIGGVGLAAAGTVFLVTRLTSGKSNAAKGPETALSVGPGGIQVRGTW